MISFHDHLTRLTHRDLRGIATRLALRRRPINDRAALIASILSAWRDPAFAAAALSRLSREAQHALQRLQSAESLPTQLFLAQYGPLRRAGAARHWQPPPWQLPASPAEELFYAGLLSIEPAAPDTAIAPRCLAPDPGTLPPLPAPKLAPASAEFPADLLSDAGQFLLYLDTAQPALLRGRWLRRRDLSAFAQRLRTPPPPAATHATHPRLSLLAFLAEAAGLAHRGALTSSAWLWLALDPSAQLARLWTAWLDAPVDLRVAFHLPAAHLPPPWPRILIDALPLSGAVITGAEVADRLLGARADLAPYFQAHFPDLAAVDHAIAATLAHTLVPFGVVAAEPPDHYVVLPFPPPDVVTAPVAAVVTPVNPAGLDISVPDLAPLAAEAQLARFAGLATVNRAAGSVTRVYRLTPSTVAAAAADGEGLPALLVALTQLGAAATPALAADLAAWWRAGRRISLTPAALLRTDTPATMAELFADPTLADILGELLAPGACLLRVSLAEARAALAAAGRPAVLLSAPPTAPHHTPAEPGFVPEPESSSPAGPPPAPDHLAGLLAGQLYRELGRHLPLPFPYRADRLAAIRERLPADQQLAAAQAAATLTDQLASLIDGASYAPPETPTDPAAWRVPLEETIESHATVEITYLGAGRNVLTRRRVEPYWIEERDGIPYLRAYCHAAARVRLFRLDRIQSLASQ